MKLNSITEVKITHYQKGLTKYKSLMMFVKRFVKAKNFF